MQTRGHGELDNYQRYHSFNKDLFVNESQVKKRIFYHLVKKFFDEVVSITAIILLMPVFIVISILIKIDDPNGPIFYSQIRIGKDGHPFRMYKFRSMVVNADEKLEILLKYNDVEGPMFKMKADPRVTPIGKIIRKYSIDELPQLLNVIKGDMSLVGPRPPLKWEVEKYTDYDRQRLIVIPGCTGLWQISKRNKVGFHEMVKLDIKYINKANTWFDIYILFKTIWIMIVPNDAY